MSKSVIETEKLDQIIALTKTAQKTNEELLKKGLSEFEIKHNAEIKALGDTITDLMTSKQEVADQLKQREDKEKELTDSLEAMEAHLKRSPVGNGSESKIDEATLKFKKDFARYARKANQFIDDDIIKGYHSNFVNGIMPYASEIEKEEVIKTLSVDSNPDGGYLVLPERNPDVQNIRDFETSPVRSVADVTTITKESFEEVIDDDESASGGWVSEKQTRVVTDTSQFGVLTFVAHEQFAQPKVTQKILDDASINIESYVATKTQDILTRTENTAFVVGNGAGKPRGFLDYEAWTTPGAYERDRLEQIASGTNGIFVADTIKQLKNSLKGIYQARAVFFIKRDEWLNIITLKDGQGNYLLDPRSFKEGDTPVLLGKPVILADDMPATATDSLSMTYGDFNAGYKIIDRAGIRVLRDPFTDKPFIKFYTTKRVGGGVKNFEALKNYRLGV